MTAVNNQLELRVGEARIDLQLKAQPMSRR